MMNVHTTRLHWPGGAVMLAVMVIVLTGCNQVSFGFTRTYETSTTFRTPGTFAAGCAEISGTLVEVAGTGQQNARSDCGLANGDRISCDWTAQHCSVACFNSAEACESTVQYLGYVPPWVTGTPVARAPAPADFAPSAYAASSGPGVPQVIGVI